MRFVLMCQVLDGEPPVRIRWFKDQVDLSEQLAGQSRMVQSSLQSMDPSMATDQQLELLMGNDDLGSSLLFRRVQQAHSGNYTCMATNHHGSSSYSSIMTVKGKLFYMILICCAFIYGYVREIWGSAFL